MYKDLSIDNLVNKLYEDMLELDILKHNFVELKKKLTTKEALNEDEKEIETLQTELLNLLVSIEEKENALDIFKNFINKNYNSNYKMLLNLAENRKNLYLANNNYIKINTAIDDFENYMQRSSLEPSFSIGSMGSSMYNKDIVDTLDDVSAKLKETIAELDRNRPDFSFLKDKSRENQSSTQKLEEDLKNMLEDIKDKPKK